MVKLVRAGRSFSRQGSPPSTRYSVLRLRPRVAVVIPTLLGLKLILAFIRPSMLFGRVFIKPCSKLGAAEGSSVAWKPGRRPKVLTTIPWVPGITVLLV